MNGVQKSGFKNIIAQLEFLVFFCIEKIRFFLKKTKGTGIFLQKHEIHLTLHLRVKVKEDSRVSLVYLIELDFKKDVERQLELHLMQNLTLIKFFVLHFKL